MTLDSEPSTPDQPKANNASKIFSVIDSVEEIEATQKLLEEYFDANIDHNHPDFR